MDYLKDPQEIYARSFATIRAEAPLDRLPEAARPIAVRIIHACGMTGIVDDLVIDERLPLEIDFAFDAINSRAIATAASSKKHDSQGGPWSPLSNASHGGVPGYRVDWK